MSLPTLHPYCVIDALPIEIAAALSADAYFADITVVVADFGNVAAEIQRKQAELTAKSVKVGVAAKVGVAVIVLPLVADDEYPDLAQGPLTLRPSIQVIENRELNLGPSGTKKSARQVARRIIEIIKPLALDGFIEGMQCEKNCIIPVPLEGEPKNLIGYQVNFLCYEADFDEQIVACAKPQFVNAANQVTFTCATAGALVYYTLDDSFPWSGNPSASSSSAPIAVPVQGLVIRAAAYAPGLLGSGVSRAIVGYD